MECFVGWWSWVVYWFRGFSYVTAHGSSQGWTSYTGIAFIQIFGYSQGKHVEFDPTYLDLPEPLNPAENPTMKIQAMKNFYPDASEPVPENAPVPRGKAVQINAFVDVDHAGNKVTQPSHTGFIIFIKH